MNGKKFMALALAGVLTISVLAGCTKKGDDDQEPTDQPSQSDTENPGTPETPETNEPENQEGDPPETPEEQDQQPTAAQTGGADDSELLVSGETSDAPAAE